MKRANIKLISIICLFSVILMALMIMAGQSNSLASDDKSKLILENTNVRVMPVHLQNHYMRQRTIYGQVQSERIIDIGFELNGRISEVQIEEGLDFEKDQILATLDLARLDAQESELKAALEQAQADAKLALLSQQRVIDLVNKGLESNQRKDEAKAQYDAALARFNQVAAQLDSIAVEKQKHILTAPFSGQVLEHYLEVGSTVAQGQSVFKLIDHTALQAKFGLPFTIANQLTNAQDLAIEFNGQIIKSSLISVERNRNLATRTVDALFALEANPFVINGDLVTLRASLPYKKTGAWVPLSALKGGPRGLWNVYVVALNSNKIEPRLVNTEYIVGDKAFVSGAIIDSENIIVDGLHRLVSNQQVKQIIKVENTYSDFSAPTSAMKK